MRKDENSFEFTATDLVGYLNCRHLSALDRQVAEGKLSKPKVWNPLLEILWERGSIHERNYIDHLTGLGLDVIRIEGIEVTSDAVEQTLAAMRDGAAVIAQAALSKDSWNGRADILLRVETLSDLGDWSYEVVDTKLARETKAGTVLQLCLYSELLSFAQGREPELMHVVAPWSDYQPQQYRFADYAAYFRKVKHQLIASFATDMQEETYPDPIDHCDICRWSQTCDKRRHDDDHLCLVAGISKTQINELQAQGISKVKSLSDMPLPLAWRPDRGSSESYTRIREQARIQVEAREANERKFELLDVVPGFGLTKLPEPSPGDVFLDLEGDPFVGEHGLEYLFGYQFTDDDGNTQYRGEWAFSRTEEKQAFESFIDFVMERWKQFPAMHIYHYAPYEPAAMKRLMGRYATREEELDQLLRGDIFVDLYQVIRHSVRASVESYSIKKLEPFYEFERVMPLANANAALAEFQAGLELDDVPSISDAAKAAVLAYNRDDCNSTEVLRDWLEILRQQLVDSGIQVPRPEPGDGAPNEKITDWILKIQVLMEKLLTGIPADPEERTEDQQALWILANIADWHRREAKAVWWELYRLADLSAEDLLDEKAGLSGLLFVGEAGGTARAPIHRYKFPLQETEIRGGEDIRNVGGDKLGSIEAVSFDDYTVDIKKRMDSRDVHPDAVFAHKYVGAEVMAESLVRLGDYVAEHGLHGHGPYLAARDLLLKAAPRTGGQQLHLENETTVEAATRLCGYLQGGILPIQGPPGAGKTYTGAQMICELVRLGKTVGITANSHKVIRNLVDATIEAANEQKLDFHCCVKAAEAEDPTDQLSFAGKNGDLLDALGSSANVGGGTAWLWAHPDASDSLDVLFVDEAAQMSLANVLAVSQAAQTVVLIGDPQQLDQPMQGSHPDGTDATALDHILNGEQTVPPDKGLFLEETWRLHPDICAYTSEMFYEGKLHSRPSLERQSISGTQPINHSGLYYLPVEHEGNQNCSREEAEAICDLVNQILDSGTTWIDRDDCESQLTLDDILIIAPYNAQVFEIQQLLPGARVGTVDKFQGQEAPISIYSMATSSHADAPRGMEFLYSLNRLNVATSRAKCASIIVSSPRVFEADCRTPRQIQLVNAFCRFLELAELIPQKSSEF